LVRLGGVRKCPRPKHGYLPAAGSDWLLWLYDPLLSISGATREYKRLIEQAGIGPEHRVLDVGCGTGTLAIWLARERPQAEIVGVDPEPSALARARRKAEHAGVRVEFKQGYAQSLPVADGSFDRVLSSFMVHHPPRETTRCMMHEVHWGLAPGRQFHLVDFMPESSDQDTFLARLLHRNEDFRNITSEQIGVLLGVAGYAEVRDQGGHKSIVGRVGSFVAVR
jgi:SAM-dependent methyltransferase